MFGKKKIELENEVYRLSEELTNIKTSLTTQQKISENLSEELTHIKTALDAQHQVNENLMFSIQSFTNMLVSVGDTLKIHQGVLVELEQHFLENFDKELELKTETKEKSKLN